MVISGKYGDFWVTLGIKIDKVNKSRFPEKYSISQITLINDQKLN